MDSAGKEKVTKPAQGPPLQARVAAANGTVLAACKHDGKLDSDPGAHGMNRGKANKSKLNGARTRDGQWA